MSEVIRVLRAEHANIATLLRTLEAQVAVLDRGEEPDYDIIRTAMDWFLSFPDVYHHPKEDLVFARLQMRNPVAAATIGDLRQKHEELSYWSRTFAEGVRSVLNDAEVPRAALVTWAQAYINLQVEHMLMEEQLLFPAAEASLTDGDWQELETVMRSEEDPLFGDGVDAHFERLRRMILRWQSHEELGAG